MTKHREAMAAESAPSAAASERNREWRERERVRTLYNRALEGGGEREKKPSQTKEERMNKSEFFSRRQIEE